MPIIFTDGLTPNLTDATFDTEKEHVKQIFTLLDNENAYVNVLETPLINLISRIDTLTTELETDANIEYLKIRIIDNEGNQRADFEYTNEGANFNLIFEVEYAGEIVLDYSLIDQSGNRNESTSSVNVIGWADIFVSDIKITGSKERVQNTKLKPF